MVTIKLSNKAVYTFIAVCIFLACVGVSYAWAPSGTGHNYGEVELPASEAVWTGLNADKLDSLDSTQLCKSDGADCWVPKGRTVGSGIVNYDDEVGIYNCKVYWAGEGADCNGPYPTFFRCPTGSKIVQISGGVGFNTNKGYICVTN